MANNKGKFTRRQFLKTAGAAVGASLLPAHLTRTLAHGVTPSANVGLQQTTRKGVIRVAWEAVKVLDPAFISNDSEIAFANAIYDYLVDPTPTAEIAPRLAESWTLSDDGLVYTFNLVKGVKFHDGRALTAADVVFSFDRLRSEEVGSPAASLFTAVESIEATDDSTVVFTLTRTQPDFLYNVADSHALIIPAGTEDPNTTFIGSGPFKLQEFIPEDRAIFVANEEYWIPGLPTLEGMEHIYMDSNAQIEALRGGSIDVVLRMPNARFVALQNDPNLQTVNYATSGHDVLRVRVDQVPGNDERVLRALKLATDREAINQAVQLGLGATGRDAPIGPYFQAYFDPETPLPPYDPEAARTLLTEAGVADLTIDLHVPNTGGRPDFATIIKDQWAQAGITVNILIEDESVYYADNGWLEVPFGITGWAARPTPQQYLDFSLRSDGKWNETRINNPELDALIDTAGTSTDQDERIAAYKAIQRILAENGPLIIPYFFPIVGAASTRFTFTNGFQPFTGRTDFRSVIEA
jgi:peptide/nickel transport system substrate-binding protein